MRWAEARVIFVVRRAEHGVRLRVEDDGPGMTRAQSESALARGVRLDTSAAGSGLGLAIVEDLMALYGGELTLDRAPLGGLAADVWLPASPVSAQLEKSG
ncbi:ATP-binding protein [Salinicola tamaricis]|uniref:ATP-binding protein n=1 Tax=Salinicola tamaricis TaxID=1771309 RepID=UPI0030F4770C